MTKLIANFIFTVTLLAACFNQAEAQQAKLEWEKDLDRAVQLASEQEKLILLHFTAEWCRPCKSLETFVFNSPLVLSLIHI